MGKRRKLNRLISRWIRSDLPEDRSTVLLLGVTRIPTSPTPARRPCSLPLAAPPTDSRQSLVFTRRRNSSSSRRRNTVSRNSTLKQARAETSTPTFIISPCQDSEVTSQDDPENSVESYTNEVTPSNCDSHGESPGTVMDRSVDSIGTCSLDVEASVETSDWSEASSIGTLRSASLQTASPEHRLPSYLSLACTVNGYSTTTNYDPERLARSRDTSPHRPNEHHAPQDNLTTYTVHNNLLSPPNLVPLPIYNNVVGPQIDTKSNMSADNTMATTHHRREFYSTSTKTSTYITSESKTMSSTVYSSDSVDSCIENGLRTSISKCVKYDTLNTNGNLCASEKSAHEYTSSKEKSVIQQRVERLYGPGFLAQGFLVMKRQRNKSYETENLGKESNGQDNHSKSMNDQLLQDDSLEGGMKQSTSSPTLPVFRHLRPEFRAQLPIVKAKKVSENCMQKSVTVPTLDGAKVNGHASDVVDKESCDNKTVILNGNASVNGVTAVNGTQDICDKHKCESDSKELVTRDGHYFLTILEKEARRLLALADKAEQELEEPGLAEEAKGYIRSAAGKAKLLVSQKMQQFKGLCTNNIKQVKGEAFPTTNEDLQGFWDMIMLQVDQIDMLFKELDILRANNWQEQKPIVTTNGNSSKPRKVIKSIRPLSASAEESRKVREAQRKKMIEDRRRAMKQQQSKSTNQSIEIFVPESS